MNNTVYKVKKYSEKLKRSKNSSERQKYFTHLKQHYVQTGGDLTVLNEIGNIVENLSNNITGDNGLIQKFQQSQQNLENIKKEQETQKKN